jgi:hypothetical protein
MLRSSVLAVGLVLAGCVPMAAPDVPVSTANLVSSSGAVLGTVRVFTEPTGVMLRIDAAGVPAGQHGVHVHTTGRCDPPGFTSAGPHWNPTDRKHGHRNPAIGTRPASTWAISAIWESERMAGWLPGCSFHRQRSMRCAMRTARRLFCMQRRTTR